MRCVVQEANNILRCISCVFLLFCDFEMHTVNLSLFRNKAEEKRNLAEKEKEQRQNVEY